MKSKERKERKVKPAPPHQHRMCIACREIAPKDELLRLRVIDGQVIADEVQRGRGCYVHQTKECLLKLKETHRLEHAFRRTERAAGKKKAGKEKGSAAGAADSKRIDFGSVHRIIDGMMNRFKSCTS